MEGEKGAMGKKRLIKWSYSPRKRTKERPSPNTLKLLEERENNLLRLVSSHHLPNKTQIDAPDQNGSHMWRSSPTSTRIKKTLKQGEKSPLTIKLQALTSLKSSMNPSPTKRPQLKDEPQSLVGDIEDLMVTVGSLGSSFFSDHLDELESNPTGARALPAQQRVEEYEDIEMVPILSDFNVCINDQESSTTPRLSPKFRSLLIESIQRGRDEMNRPQILLTCSDKTAAIQEQGEESTTVYVVVGGLWIECDYQAGHRVNIVPWTNSSIIYIPSSINPNTDTLGAAADERPYFLTYVPECLISITTIADSVACIRKGALSLRYQPAPQDNKPTLQLVSGSITHDVFEHGILRETPLDDSNQIDELVAEAIRAHLSTIYAADKEEVDVIKSVKDLLKFFPQWYQQVRKSRIDPADSVKVIDEVKCTLPESTRAICIPKVYSLEESITSRALGIKGKLDAIVQLDYPSAIGVAGDGSDVNSLLVPLELKTGKSTNSHSHRAQTLLYTILMTDRFGIPIHYGLIYYIANNLLMRVGSSGDELEALMMIRNRLAATTLWTKASADIDSSQLPNLPHPLQGHQIQHLQQMGTASRKPIRIERLPPPIGNGHTCKMCSQLQNCSIAAAYLDEAGKVNEVIKERLPSPSAEVNWDFFERWKRLVDLEELAALSDRASHSVALSGHLLRVSRNKTMIGFGKFTIEFAVKPGNDAFEKRMDIIAGDPVVIYSDPLGEDEVAIGFILSISLENLTITADRDPSITMAPIVAAAPPALATTGIRQIYETKSALNQVFHVGKNELTSGFTLGRSNLLHLYGPTQRNLLSLLTETKRVPKFMEKITFEMATQLSVHTTSTNCGGLTGKQSKLDSGQMEAIEHCLRAKDYALVLGMPGTGKTTTIVALITILIALGNRVLVSSYTHSAVDNLLVKLLDILGPDISDCVLRVGNHDKIHPKLSSSGCLLAPGKAPFDSVASIRSAMSRARVVGVTCLGCNNTLLHGPKVANTAAANGAAIFDYCIVDEASQVTIPSILGPLFMAEKFILAGDHFQLPPLVHSKEAMAEGLNSSLFKLLAGKHPSSMVILRRQYRMNQQIMLIANRIIYNNQLICGSEAVRDAIINLPYLQQDQGQHATEHGLFCSRCGENASCWLRTVLEPRRAVIFLDTDSLPAWEQPAGSSLFNPIEAEIAVRILETFLGCGIKAEQLSVITPYRPQVRSISDLLQAPLSSASLVNGNAAATNGFARGHSTVEISTVDKYQGRDKDCVILSMVRSNTEGNIGSLLKDWNRLNVAFTRARQKLIIIGSWSTLFTPNPIFLEGSSILPPDIANSQERRSMEEKAAIKNYALLKELILDNGWYFPLPNSAHLHEFL